MNMSRLARALALAVFACLLLTAPAQSAWPGKNGAIVFARNKPPKAGGDADLWVQLPSGKQRRLTAGQASDGEPTYSANGRLIAFVRYSNGGSALWVMSSDGTNERPVVETEERRFATEPEFMPSGRRLVFAFGGLPGGSKIYSVRLDGSRLQELVDHAKAPAVSPDGRWLAFWHQSAGDRIRIQDLRSGAVRQLPTGLGFAPDFSPDGKELVFEGRRSCGKRGQLRQSLMTIGLDDRRPRMLFDTCGLSFIAYGPAWSPQGDRVIFTRRPRPREAATENRLQILNRRGELVPGAPPHQPGALEGGASWQPLSGRGR